MEIELAPEVGRIDGAGTGDVCGESGEGPGAQSGRIASASLRLLVLEEIPAYMRHDVHRSSASVIKAFKAQSCAASASLLATKQGVTAAVVCAICNTEQDPFPGMVKHLSISSSNSKSDVESS